MEQQKDRELWEKAKARASFKKHLLTYCIIIAMLWVVWFLTDRQYNERIPWPLWVMFGWGIGIVSHYIRAYTSFDLFSTEKEYQKLKGNGNFN